MNYNKPPKFVYDKEYSTQYKPEVEYLENHGIVPSYIKEHPVYRVKTFKYTKTAKLFRALTFFYAEQESE